MITTDQELPYQQNFTGRRISILILFAPTNRLADPELLVSSALRSLETIATGEIIRIRRGLTT